MNKKTEILLKKYNIHSNLLNFNFKILSITYFNNSFEIDGDDITFNDKFELLIFDYLKDSIKKLNLLNEKNRQIFYYLFSKVEDRTILLQHQFLNRDINYIFNKFDELEKYIEVYLSFGSVDKYVDYILSKDNNLINDFNIYLIFKYSEYLKKKYNYLIQAKNFDLI